MSCSSRENSPNTQKTPDSGHVSQDPKSDNSSNQSSPEVLITTKNRCAWRTGRSSITHIDHTSFAKLLINPQLSAACWITRSVLNPGCSSYLVGRAPSIPEGQDLSRSSSNASSLASVVEENDTEATEDYDTGMVRALFSFWSFCVCVWVWSARIRCCTLQESLSSAGTPHKRDSFTYSAWLEDGISSTSSTSRGNSPGGTTLLFNTRYHCPHDESRKKQMLNGLLMHR